VHRCIVIGGYGRSGTTIIRDILATHPRVVSFGTVESKFFTEPYGLLDLFRALVSDYTIGRGDTAIKEFRVLMRTQLPDPNYFGQASILEPLGGNWPAYRDLIDDFTNSLRENTLAKYMAESDFFEVTERFVQGLLSLIVSRSKEADTFVEKTPHNAHNPWIFERLFAQRRYLWIVRDPRAVVYSLSKQEWSSHRLDVCCTWAKQVIRRFYDTYKTVPNLCLSIEQIASDTMRAFDMISTHCDIDISSGVQIFDPAKVFDWRCHLAGEDLKQVESSLSEEINLFKSLALG